jgi:acetyl esterase/lipase
VVICPGGGYSGTATDHEGAQVAAVLREAGIAAFVLRYRIPDDRYCRDRSVAPWQDAQQAIRLVRSRADAWGLDAGRIGIMGFSAGGHLAATAATHFLTKADPQATDTISARPDFVALIYPVISMREGVGHMGSRERLLGPQPDAAKIDFFSNELHVTADSPPAFLLHTQDDFVSVRNSLLFHAACLENRVPAEMHLFPSGGHGYGLRHPGGEGSWASLLLDWLSRTSAAPGR